MKVQLGIVVLTIIVASIPAYLIVTGPNYTGGSAQNEGNEAVRRPDVKEAVREIIKEVPNVGDLPQIVEQPPEIVKPPVDELPKIPIQPREPQVVRDPPPKSPAEPPIQKIVEPPIIPNPAVGGGLLGQYWQDSFFGVWPLEEVPKCSEKGPRHTPAKLPEPNLTRVDINFITAASRPLGNHEYSNSWTGTLIVFADNIYEFKITDNGGDWAWMYIDKMLVQTSRGELWGGGQRLEGKIIFDPGSHEISILRWDQCSLGKGVELFWKTLGDKEFTPLTAQNLRPKNTSVRLFVADIICREWDRCDGLPEQKRNILLPIAPSGFFEIMLTGSAIKNVSNFQLVDLEVGKPSTIKLVLSSKAPINVRFNLEARNVPEGIIISFKPNNVEVPRYSRIVVDVEITAFRVSAANSTAKVIIIARNELISWSRELLLRVPEIRPNSLEAIAKMEFLAHRYQDNILIRT